MPQTTFIDMDDNIHVIVVENADMYNYIIIFYIAYWYVNTVIVILVLIA